MATSNPLRLAYYGDDFTGSTDALECLTAAGLRTALFLNPPTPDQLARHPNLEAIGVAGLSRALAPDTMETELRSAFSALRALGPRHVHYKVCSTFDSSPTVGSIGRAIEVGAEVFATRWVPLVVSAPSLGRHCVFGHLFARMGIGSTGAIHRLDRHPAMSRHPVTPADESDLRLHLAKQTAKKIGLVDLLDLDGPWAAARAAVQREVTSGAEIVLFDALYARQMERIGALIDEAATGPGPLFSVGSSGVETALGDHWRTRGLAVVPASLPSPGPASPLLILSGSCSPVTAGQIAWAESAGYTLIAMDPATRDHEAIAAQAIKSLQSGRHTLVHTSRGQAGPPVSSRELGTALGRVGRAAVAETGIRRLLIAGGDTSSYAGRALGVEALTMLAPLAPGAPLCRVSAAGDLVDGLEINFKGGQVGAPDYFAAVARGQIHSTL